MGSQSLSGKVIAVTGGARGIGREIAAQLAAAGANVSIGDRDHAAVTATAAELGRAVDSFLLDVTDSASFTAFLDGVEAAHGPINVLVNNAGVMWVGSFADEPENATEQMLAVNLHGVIRGVKLMAPRMVARGHGHIVTIASAASKLAPPGEATYCATKHGVFGYLTAVRAELRGSGVNLTAIMPSVVDTELAIGTETGAAKLMSPSTVAAAVVAVVRRPRFEVMLPSYVNPLTRFVNLLPRPLRDAALRAAVPDQVAAVQGNSIRANYEKSLTGAKNAGPKIPTKSAGDE